MKHAWEPIADSLREEIVEYGQLLDLFNEQQKLLFQSDAEGVLRLSRCIEGQVTRLGAYREIRERCVAEYAIANGQPPFSNLRALVGLLPPEVKPLFENLVAQVNLLIHRVRRGSRQNHRILAAVVECHQDILMRLRPDDFTKTYGKSGRVTLSPSRASPPLQTVG
jgi:hypothetical protein